METVHFFYLSDGALFRVVVYKLRFERQYGWMIYGVYVEDTGMCGTFKIPLY